MKENEENRTHIRLLWIIVLLMLIGFVRLEIRVNALAKSQHVQVSAWGAVSPAVEPAP